MAKVVLGDAPCNRKPGYIQHTFTVESHDAVTSVFSFQHRHVTEKNRTKKTKINEVEN